MAGQRQDGRSRMLRAHFFNCGYRTREGSGSRVSLCLSKLVPSNSDTHTSSSEAALPKPPQLGTKCSNTWAYQGHSDLRTKTSEAVFQSSQFLMLPTSHTQISYFFFLKYKIQPQDTFSFIQADSHTQLGDGGDEWYKMSPSRALPPPEVRKPLGNQIVLAYCNASQWKAPQ